MIDEVCSPLATFTLISFCLFLSFSSLLSPLSSPLPSPLLSLSLSLSPSLRKVQTGMGRTGKLWGHEHLGVSPDVFTSGTPLYFLYSSLFSLLSPFSSFLSPLSVHLFLLSSLFSLLSPLSFLPFLFFIFTLSLLLFFFISLLFSSLLSFYHSSLLSSPLLSSSLPSSPLLSSLSAKALGGGVPIGAMLCKDSCNVFEVEAHNHQYTSFLSKLIFFILLSPLSSLLFPLSSHFSPFSSLLFSLLSPFSSKHLQPGDHASTYGGNPLACAASLAVTRAFEEEVFALSSLPSLHSPLPSPLTSPFPPSSSLSSLPFPFHLCIIYA